MAAQGGQINFKVGFQADQASLNSLKKSLQDLQNIKLADFKGSKQELTQLKQTARGVETALKNAFNVNLNALNVKEFNQQLTKSVGSIDKIYKDFSKAGVQGQVAFSQMASSVLTTNLQLKETNSIIQKMGTTLVNSIKWNIASSAINSFTQGVQSAFQYVKSLEGSLTDIRIVTGDSQQKMQDFAASANKAAQALGRSTMDYTKSALTFYQQGLDDEAVAARTEAVLKAQNITGAGSEMADYLTAVWNGYQVANEQAELYVDKLAAVADSSASDMSQLAIAMSRVSSTANTMGVDVDQLTAQIATVIATTRQAPQSVGTAFKTIYARLNDIKVGADGAQISLGNYSGRMANLGIQVLDSNGRLRDTGQIMEQIGDRWQELTKEQQIYLASTMGGQRQVNQLMALFDHWTTYSELLNTSLESQGSLAEKNSRYMESLGAKMEQLGAAQERVKDAFIDTDSWKSVIEAMTSIMSLFGNFVESLGGGGNALLAFGSIATQVFSGAISEELNKIITNINNVKNNAQKLKNDIAMTEAFGASQGYDDKIISDMVNAKQEIAQYYSILSSQQINSYNNIVKQIGATQDQVNVTNDLIGKIQTFQSELAKAGEAINNNLTTQIDIATEEAEQLSNILNRYSSISFLEENQADAIKEFQGIFRSLKETLGEQSLAVPALKDFQNSLSSIKEKGSATKNELVDLRNAAKAALGQINNVLGHDLDEVKAQAKEDAAALQLAKLKKEQFLGNVEQQAFSRMLVDSVSTIGRLTSGITSLVNITKIWNNENLSAGEKSLQTITNLGFVIPTLVTSFQKLQQIIKQIVLLQDTQHAITSMQSAARITQIKAMTAAQALHANQIKITTIQLKLEKLALIQRDAAAKGANITTATSIKRQALETELRGLNTTATGLQATSEELDALAKQQNAAATALLNQRMKQLFITMLHNPIVILIAAIGGLALAYDALTLSTKEADQAIEKSTQAYDEAKNKLQSLQNQLKTTQDRIKELESQGSLTLVQQEELAKLRATNTELELQIQNQKEILRLKQKEQALDVKNKINKTKAYDAEDVSDFLNKHGSTATQENDVREKIQSLSGIDLNKTDITDIESLTKLEDSLKETRSINQLLKFNMNPAKIKQDISKAKEQGMKILRDSYSDMISQLHILQQEQKNNPKVDNSKEIGVLTNLLHQYYFGSGQIDSIVGKIISDTGKINQQVFNKAKDQLQETKEQITDDNAQSILTSLFGKEDSQLLKIQLDGIGLSIKDFLMTIKTSKLDWSGFLNASGLDQEKNKVTGTLASLSTITSTGEKLQQGKSPSAKEIQTYKGELDTLIETESEKGTQANQDLINSAELLKNTWLAGSEQYQKALEKVQIKLIELNQLQAQESGQGLTDQQIAQLQSYATTIERVNSLYGQGLIKDQAHYHALLDKAIGNQLKTLKVSGSVYKNYFKQLEKISKTTQKVIDGVDNFGKSIDLTEDSLKEMTLNDLILIDSLEELQKVYKNLEDDLNKPQDSPKFIQAFSEVIDIINKIPGININPEEENATEYLTNIKQLAQGVEGALGRLRKQIALNELKVMIDAGLESDTQQRLLNEINSMIENMSPQDIETHAYLYSPQFIAALNGLMRGSEQARDYCNKILGSIGAKAKVTGYTEIGIDNTQLQAGSAGAFQMLNHSDGISDQGRNKTYVKMPIIQYQPFTSGQQTGEIINDGGKKSSGGGGSEGKPKTKDLKKQTRDAYHDINRQIQHLTNSYKELEDQEDKLVGNNLIDNLEDQNKLLQEQKVLYNDKLGLIDSQQERLKQLLQVQSVVFDPQSGQITNYNQILDQKLAEYNKQVQAYNAMSADAQKQHQEELKKAQKEYQEFKKNLEEYQKTLDLRRTVLDAIDDIDEKWIENNIKAFKVKVQLDLDLSQAKRDWNQFEKEVIDQIRDDDILGNVQTRLKDIYSYFGDDLDGGVIQSLTDQVNGTLDELQELENGVSDIYGENQAQALEDLKNYSEKLMDSLKDVQQILKDVKQAFFDVIDAAQKAFDEQTDEYEFLGELLEHDKKLIEMIYGQQAYEKLSKYNDKRAAADKNALDFAKQQKDFWWDQMQAQKERMEGLNEQSNAYKEAEQRFKQLEQHWLDAVKDFNSKVQQSIENLLDNYQNNVSIIFKDLGDKLSGGKGLDYLEQQWQVMNDHADDYLDKVNALYKIQKLRDSYQDAIDENKDSAKAQASLNEMMNQQLKMLKDKDKLTQYDVDRANLLLQIQIKRLALQQAQQNNSKLRLRRDSQGNYTYQYVADNSAIENAQGEISDLQNQLYNLDKETYTGNLNNIYGLEKEASEKLQELYNEYPTWTAEAEAKKQLILNQYNNLINNQVARNEQIKLNLQSSAFDELAELQNENLNNFLNMSKTEQDQIMNNLVPQWNSGVQQMTDTFAGQGGFIPTCQEALNALKDNTQDYENELDELEEIANKNFESIGQGIDDTIEKTQSLIDDNEILIDTYYDEFDAINDVIDSLIDLANSYDDVRDAAIDAARAAMQFREAMGEDTGDIIDDVTPQNQSKEGRWKNIAENEGDFSWIYQVNGKRVTGQQKNISYTDPNGRSFVADYNFDENGILLPSNENSSHNGQYGAINIREVTSSMDRLNDTMNKMIDDIPGYVSGSKMIDDTPSYVSVRRIASGASGMYTGSWGDNSGKLAVLHQKQLVLNKEDTSNILSTVNIVRSMSDLLLGLQDNLIPSIISQNSFGIATKNSLDQNVHITASFPSVQNHTEIEMALNNLVNRASQYAFSNNR